MKKEEKTKLTRERIIRSAIAEFGTKNYDSASLNTICTANHISKGLIYHNFKNKDEIYLVCVKKSFDELTEYLKKSDHNSQDILEEIRGLLKARQEFVQENPYYGHIFFCSVLMPPQHLLKEIKEMRKNYDDYLRERYTYLLGKICLRDGVKVEKAVEYLMLFQEMYNGFFREKACESSELNRVIETHETGISELFDILLYGIARKNDE